MRTNQWSTTMAAGAVVLAALALGSASAWATCGVDSVAGTPLVVEEPTPGAWQAAAEAATALLREAKVAGELFSRVYLGGYLKQQVQRELAASDEAYEQGKAAALAALVPFEGTCAGDILAAAIRKADRYRDPERTMVVNALAGKPIQASQKEIHDGRSLDYREFERKFQGIVETGDVRAGAPAPVEEPAGTDAGTPVEEPAGGDAGAPGAGGGNGG